MASSKRERELARLRAERQVARRAAEAARRRQRNAVIATVVAVALVAGGVVYLAANLHSSKKASALASPSAAASATPAAAATTEPNTATTCAYTGTTQRSPRVISFPPPTPDRTHVYTAKIVTNRGEIDFDTLTSRAPCTVNSFRSLAHFGYFDRTICHRLVLSVPYVLQCGDPLATGTGGPGYKFPDENLAGARYAAGTVAMANGGPGTNGSQFFIVYKDSLSLPPNYTPFGIVTKGLDVVQRIAAGGVTSAGNPSDGMPKLSVQIQSVRVVPKAA